MSGKIESKQDSQRSHLSSFTMKLMDKFHSPKIKRTPSKKVSKPPLEHSVKTAEKPANKGLSRLEEHEKDVVSALRYFKTIIDKMAVDKKVLEMLPGSASKVLEAILPLVQVEPRIQHSSAVSSCLNRVYQSLGNLIRWSDQVMLEGVNLEDKETIVTVTTVIKAVLDGVKELVKLTIEKQEHPSPTSPVKPVPPAALTESAAEPPAKEKESLDKSSATTQSTEVLTEPTEEEAEEVAPPKPPLPGVKMAEHNPPALPPKKRQSAPSPTRVAVVAPMSHATSGSGLPMGTGLHKQEYEVDALQRRFSGGSHSYGGESPRLSPCNSMGKLSKSDEQLSWTVDSGQCSRNTSCETLDHYDPDYDFLHQDLSSLEQMPPLPVGGCLSPLPESHSESSSPSPCPGPGPPLKRRSGASSGISDGSYSGSSCETADVPQSPPPLPEKKSRHILKYMQFVEDYSEPQPSLFYQTPQSESIYEQRNKRFQEVYSFNDSYSSDSVHEPLPPPALPPKQRQLSESANEEVGEGEYVNLYSSSQAKGDGPLSRRVSSVALAERGGMRKRRERRERGAFTNTSDDGPDVRAGSGDILLVHATETDRKDLVLYCEAFLTTYRTFITPEDLIKKLHYRYPFHASHLTYTFKKRVSKNTFFVLVRVVDELCLVEMTEDILKQLMDLVFRLVCNGELSLARVLRKNILDKVEQRKLLRYTNSLKPLAARGVAARPGTLHDFRSHEIADQLTLLDAELFYKIEIPEVLLWAKEQNEEKSPNLTQFTEHFNNMSYWVRSIIILQEKAQDREKLLLKFIKIMKHLRKLNNFNSYLAILSALDSAPIRRLEWQKTTSEGLEEYCTLIDSSSSFRAYRAALADVEPPCIPYLGLILQDLTFVHLGNPDLINGKVNFSKRWQQFNILDSMRRFQQVHYDLKHNDDIVSFFNDFSDHLAEEALWELSLKIKPRNITRRKTEREEKT
uniref:CRK SH3-binding GNRP n=1 Tax=Oncorhynchus tshawytscha TaxID=74940 RepID=A0A8C8MLP2_ONCTS